MSEDEQCTANEKLSVWITRREDQEEEDPGRDTGQNRGQDSRSKEEEEAGRGEAVRGGRLVLLLVGLLAAGRAW